MEKTERKGLFAQSLKGGLLAFVLSTAFVLILALIAKLFTMSASSLPIINQVLKGIAVALSVAFFVKENKFLLKGVLVGVIFSILNLVLFVILGGQLNWAQIGIDFALSIVIGVLVALLKSRKK